MKNEEDTIITKMFCISCVEGSLKYLEREESEETIMEIASAVYDYWLDTSVQISELSDIVCEHWEEYLEDEDNFNIYDYVEEVF